VNCEDETGLKRLHDCLRNDGSEELHSRLFKVLNSEVYEFCKNNFEDKQNEISLLTAYLAEKTGLINTMKVLFNDLMSSQRKKYKELFEATYVASFKDFTI
jgi:hypothetical protein